MGPDAHERLLRDVLGIRGVAEDTAGKPSMAGKWRRESNWNARSSPRATRAMSASSLSSIAMRWLPWGTPVHSSPWPIQLTGEAPETCAADYSGKLRDKAGPFRFLTLLNYRALQPVFGRELQPFYQPIHRLAVRYRDSETVRPHGQ